MEKDIEECNFPNNISFFFQYDENKIIKHAGKDNIIFVHIYTYIHDPVWWIFFKGTLDKSVIIVYHWSQELRSRRLKLYYTSVSVKRFRCLVEA